jgi:tetratricopeptide (TPR) repeat protein
MRTKEWLNVTEWLLLAGSGIGSIASIASQQLAFTAAPMSFLLLLNLVNRQRANQDAQDKSSTKIVQLDQKLSQRIEALDQQVKTLPTLSDLSRFTRAVSQRNEDTISHLQQHISQRLAPLESYDLRRMTQEVSDLQHQYTKLSDSVSAMATNANRLASTNRVEGAERAIAQLKSEVTQLQTKLSEASSSQKQNVPKALQDEIYSIHRRLNSLPQPFDATALKQDVDGLIKIVGDMVSRRDLARLMAEVEKVRRQHQHLEQTVAPMKVVNTIMRKQMDTLSSWVQSTEPQALSNRGGAKNPDAEYELVFNLQASHDRQTDTGASSRVLLEAALKAARSRVIVVFPYPDRTTLDAELITQFQSFLTRGGSLDIGWGHLGNLEESHRARYIHDRDSDAATRKILAAILPQLTQLKRDYPNQFRFKVLGTGENFLVCDQAYAILGIHPVATSSAAFPEVAVGLQTSNADVVKGLIDRYDDPVLPADDEVAYYNRAITRYELGDKQGAISDYNEVVQINPAHYIAYNNRALVRDELGHKEDAIADLNRSIVSNPRHCIAYCNRGIIRLRSGDKAGAIEDFSYAIQVDPACTNALLQRGLAWMSLGTEMNAINDFTAMIRINPQDPIGYLHRGLARSKMGDRTHAIRDLKESAWLFSSKGDHAKYQYALNAINKLRTRPVTEPCQERVLQES